MALHHTDAVERLGITDGRTVTVVTLRSAGEERAALAAIGPPFLASWADDVVAVVLGRRRPTGPRSGSWSPRATGCSRPRRLVRELDEPG